jgi:hypothetical protein
MTMQSWNGDLVVLAGTGEVRIVESTADAERELAGGFRPAVVLVGSHLCGPGAAELARRLGADPGRPSIPVLAVSGDGDRLRLTSVSDDLPPPSTPEELSRLLEVLDGLCTAEPLRLAG